MADNYYKAHSWAGYRPGVRRWASDKRLPIVFTILALALLVLVYWAIITNPPAPQSEPKVFLRLIRDAIPSACVGLVVYLIVNYLLYQQQIASARHYGDELVRSFIDGLGDQHTGLNQLIHERAKFNWSPLIKKAKTITILTRYWDDEATHHRRSFIDFFKAGGTVKLYAPNPLNQESRRISAEQRSAALEPHIAQIAIRILRTVTEFKAAAANANDELKKAGEPEIDITECIYLRYTRHAPNYECQMFDETDVIFTPYSHFFMPEALCPAMWFDLRYADNVREFLLCDLQHLRDQRSDAVVIEDAVKLYEHLRDQEPDLGDEFTDRYPESSGRV